MENEVKKDKVENGCATSERIPLSKESLTIIDQVTQQALPNMKGVRLTRGMLVQWMIGQFRSGLSQSELEDLSRTYYNPLRHLEWLTKRIKVEGKNGEFDISTLIQKELEPLLNKPDRKPVCKSRTVREAHETNSNK